MAESFETIIGELCDCGHEKTDHLDLLNGLAVGHGACKINDCKCDKFTWASFIFAGENAVNSKKGENMD